MKIGFYEDPEAYTARVELDALINMERLQRQIFVAECGNLCALLVLNFVVYYLWTA